MRIAWAVAVSTICAFVAVADGRAGGNDCLSATGVVPRIAAGGVIASVETTRGVDWGIRVDCVGINCWSGAAWVAPFRTIAGPAGTGSRLLASLTRGVAVGVVSAFAIDRASAVATPGGIASVLGSFRYRVSS